MEQTPDPQGGNTEIQNNTKDPLTTSRQTPGDLEVNYLFGVGSKLDIQCQLIGKKGGQFAPARHGQFTPAKCSQIAQLLKALTI